MDRSKTKKFNSLADDIQNIVEGSPWPAYFEKKNFDNNSNITTGEAVCISYNDTQKKIYTVKMNSFDILTSSETSTKLNPNPEPKEKVDTKIIENNIQEKKDSNPIEEKKVNQTTNRPENVEKHNNRNKIKNLFLCNNFYSVTENNSPLNRSEDIPLLEKYSFFAYCIKYACSEILGHNTGEFLRKDKDNNFNFDIEKDTNPLTDKIIDKW